MVKVEKDTPPDSPSTRSGADVPLDVAKDTPSTPSMGGRADVPLEKESDEKPK